MKTLHTIALWTLSTLALYACGGPANSRQIGANPAAGNGAACQSQSDCPTGQACLTLNGVSACALSCTASASACSGSATCSGVGSINASFCAPPPAMTTDAGTPARVEDQPRAPCRADGECAALHAGAVCGAALGVRDCTIACTARAQCNPPALGGIATDFMDCVTDESNPVRKICAPDPRCFQGNPTACVTFAVPPDPFADAGF
jgi:hypothetical protein